MAPKSFKERLIKQYPDKFVITKDNQVLEVADSVIKATQQARKNYPEIIKFKLIHTASMKPHWRQLGWRMRRIKP